MAPPGTACSAGSPPSSPTQHAIPPAWRQKPRHLRNIMRRKQIASDGRSKAGVLMCTAHQRQDRHYWMLMAASVEMQLSMSSKISDAAALGAGGRSVVRTHGLALTLCHHLHPEWRGALVCQRAAFRHTLPHLRQCEGCAVAMYSSTAQHWKGIMPGGCVMRAGEVTQLCCPSAAAHQGAGIGHVQRRQQRRALVGVRLLQFIERRGD